MNLSVNYWVIVPAAGIGSRMQSALPKQYLSIAGKTVIEHTLESLLNCKPLQQILVCLSSADAHWSTLAISANNRIKTTIGGDTRADSVLNGLDYLSKRARDNDWVLVHDAARPCIQAATIESMIDSLASDSVGGILATRANDTLKRQDTGDDVRIAETVDRSMIWQAQTPQMFRFGLLRDALRQANQQKIEITDEASAVEWAGHAPRLVKGKASNIKITTPADIALAEFLLSAKSSTISG